jgi:hypothetical protein
MKMLNRILFARCLAATLLLSVSHVLAAQLPEFGKSVEFDPAGPQPTVAKLKGKAIILLFFQSSDKTSNGWAGKLIAEMQEAYGTNNAVAMIALKTDGGGVSSAKGYFSSKSANLNQWIVGSDADAQYSTSVVGDPLWYYVIAGADGTIVTRGKAGVTHHVVKGPNKEREQHYSLADTKLLKSCGKIATLLPAGKSYDPAVSAFVRLAEMGDTEKALAQCTLFLSKPKERQAAAALIADLQPVVEKRVNERVAILSDAAALSPARYDAFNELAQMAKDLKNHPAAAKISPLIAKARLDPALQKEARAEMAYKNTMARVQKASARDKPRLAKELETLAKQNPGTKYGQLAADSAEELASSIDTGTK